MPGFSRSVLAKRVQGSTMEIVDEAGNGLSGVTITTSANANISFTYNTGSNLTYLLPPGQQVITATKAGYVTKKTAVNISGVVQVTIVLANATDIQSTHIINSANSNPVTVTNTARAENNATVDFPAGAIVDSNGDPVSNVTVQIANVSVSDTGSVDIFPGTFIGNDAGTIDSIESFGFMNVTLTNTATGAALTLDPAIGATVRLPVDPDPIGTDTIGTYRLDESTGVWDLEGTAYRVPGTNIFEFPVTSFSWWNLDKVYGSLPFECQIYEGDDDSSTNDDSTVFSQPVPPGESPKEGVKVTVERPSDTPITMATGYSDAQGFCQIPFAPGGFVYIRGRKGNKYYTPTYVTVDGGTIKAVLRPNGTVPTWPPAATLTANTFIAYQGGVITFSLYVQGVDFTPKAYTITGVTSSDIGGAALTGTIALTEDIGNPGRYNTATGTLTLTAGDVGQTSKTFTVTLNDTIGGSVISRSVTIMGPQNDAERSTLGLALDTTGTGTQYIPYSSPLYVAAGHKVKVTLATKGIANMSLAYNITGIISSDINGGSLSGNLQVVNGNPTADTSLSTLILTINPSFAGSKTAIFTVTFADSSFLSAVLYLSTGGGDSGGGS